MKYAVLTPDNPRLIGTVTVIVVAAVHSVIFPKWSAVRVIAVAAVVCSVFSGSLAACAAAAEPAGSAPTSVASRTTTPVPAWCVQRCVMYIIRTTPFVTCEAGITANRIVGSRAIAHGVDVRI